MRLNVWPWQVCRKHGLNTARFYKLKAKEQSCPGPAEGANLKVLPGKDRQRRRDMFGELVVDGRDRRHKGKAFL